MGPVLGPRCMLGFALKPRSITRVTDLGCQGAAISKAVFLTKCYHAVSRTRRWMSWPTNFLAIDCFPRLQLMAPWPVLSVFRLGSRRLYDRPRGDVVKRLINLATHPKSMQQDRQLPRYCYRRSLLCVRSCSRSPPALTSAIRFRTTS